MTLDMGPMLRGETDRIKIDYMLTPESVRGAEFSSDAHVTGEITDDGGYMQMKLEAELPYKTVCARCLTPVEDVFRMEFVRTVADEGTLTEEQLEANVDEYVVIEHGKLNVDEELRENLILEFPMKILCREDCPGLCPKCGKPLKDGDCGCKTVEIDPRLAVLKNWKPASDDENTES